MITDSINLFSAKPVKNEAITLRLSWDEKQRIASMAERKGMNVSKFIMSLIADENQRFINENFFDDLPF
jgi:uncharacterized protein (DUF1778 family)